MNDCRKDLIEAIEEKLKIFTSDLGKINNREVQSISWITVTSIEGLPEKESKLFSGKEILIKPEGSIRFMEKLPNCAIGVTMKFWSLNMKISFNNENEQFVVNEIGDFGAFD